MLIQKFLKNKYKNISGITVIDSGKPGKNIGILAITHGNETVGLKIFKYLEEDITIKKKLQQGKIFLITMNPLAYKKQTRFIDDNMNRISNQIFNPQSYEYKRLEELKPILNELDIVLDIHSFSNSYDLVAICDKNNIQTTKAIFSLETILVDDLKKSGSIIGYCKRNNTEGYGIECGHHNDPNGLEKGKQQIINFLSYYNAIHINSYNSTNNIEHQNIYQFKEKIQPLTDNFTFTKPFVGFTSLEENEIFAKDQDKEYRNTLGKNIYLGIPAKNPKATDGAGFLFEKLE
ncbi:MAG: hypothetical protein CR971_00605 [candidate division SR1 bacterium]|nr:MAG: hypothetical protein CR971_00605 [candidate division SR1 bacterium]